MKNYFILSLSFIILFTISCSKEESPRPIAEKFLNAMQARDFTEASKFGTKETIKLLKQLERIEKLNESDLIEKSGKINIVSEDIQGNTAIVYFTEKGNELQQKITLKRISSVDGENKKEWKVDLKKEEMPIKKHPLIQQSNDPVPSKIPV